MNIKMSGGTGTGGTIVVPAMIASGNTIVLGATMKPQSNLLNALFSMMPSNRLKGLTMFLKHQKPDPDEIPDILEALNLEDREKAIELLAPYMTPRTQTTLPSDQTVDPEEIKRVLSCVWEEDRKLLYQWKGALPPLEKQIQSWFGRLLLRLARWFG